MASLATSVPDRATQIIGDYLGENVESIPLTKKGKERLTATFFESVGTRRQSSDKSFEAELVQLGPNFKVGMPITLKEVPQLVQEKVLQKVHTTVHETTETFDFEKNGFEFANFDGTPLRGALRTLASDPAARANRVQLRSQVEKELSAWGKHKGIKFTKAVCVDTIIRNTDGGRFGAVHLVHVDFPAGMDRETLQGHAEWREKVAEKFGDLSPQQYESLPVKKTVNMWMCLDKHLEAEPLAVMDTSSLDERSDLRLYQAERVDGGKFPSVGVVPAKGQRWVTKKDMGLGDAIIFDSCHTPHTAVTRPDQGTKSRTSVECRVLFLDPPLKK